ncbi:CLUMA_CG017489, isoform A [Clunio marinus]|uniref:CLUMA_CG017489, isoform A n=1 Tax=Clunio marinus TaxID=568069 RepID=A0A1J1IVV4_9DIPT|nr:CLUMA_CG017489, isoform A [Clunio marinus]
MDIQTAINTPFVRIRFIGFVHFTLLVNAMLSHWLPPAYMFYNILFLVSILWAIHSRESVDAIHTAAAINFSSFFFDFIIVIAFFPSVGGIWSTIFAVINLCVRPFSLLLLHKELVDRGGDFVLVSVASNNPPNNARTPRSYQDIDGSRQNIPNSQSAQSNISNLF